MEPNEESQEPVLPKGLFRNRFTWLCHEISKILMCWVLSGVLVIVGLIMINIGSCSTGSAQKDALLHLTAFPTAVWCPSSIPSATLAWITLLKRRSKYSLQLAQKVFELNPGSDFEKWDLISSHLNDHFYHRKDWKTYNFFFNGEDAQDLFRINVLKPYLDGKLDATTSPNEIESAKIYLKSLKKEFEFKLREFLVDHSLEVELRRDSKRKGFFKCLKDEVLCLFIGLGFLFVFFFPMMWFVLAVCNLLVALIISPLFFSSFIFCLCMFFLVGYGMIVIYGMLVSPFLDPDLRLE